MELTVECQKRPEGSKPKALRRNGQIPGNLYGHNGTESVALSIDARVVERLLKKASVNNTLINLKVTDIPWQGKTLLREVQTHPAKGTPYHLSFFAIAGHGPTDVEIPLRFVGDAIGVKQNGGILDPLVTELEVRCDPENIPAHIEVDVSKLDIGDSIHVNEINLPAGVTVLTEGTQTVVTVLAPQKSSDTETESQSATT
jgi:large subunit ribosomal protein L25